MAVDKAQLFLDMAMNVPAAIRRNLTGLQTITSINVGSIVQFKYTFAKHDPKPLVLLTDISGEYYKGLNLHYLRATPVMNLIRADRMNACNRRTFSWNDVKNNAYIKESFRIYKKIGITNIGLLNCEYLKLIIAASKKLDVQDLTAYRLNIDKQIAKEVNRSVQQFMNRA